MEPAGWAVMLISVGSVVTLVIYCVSRVLTLPAVEDESPRD